MSRIEIKSRQDRFIFDDNVYLLKSIILRLGFKTYMTLDENDNLTVFDENIMGGLTTHCFNFNDYGVLRSDFLNEIKELDSIYIKPKLSIDEIKQFLKNQNSFIFDNKNLYIESSKNNIMFKTFQSKEMIEAYSIIGFYYNNVDLIEDDLRFIESRLCAVDRVNHYITELSNFKNKIIGQHVNIIKNSEKIDFWYNVLSEIKKLN